MKIIFLWSSHDEKGAHPNIIVGGKPLVGGQLIPSYAQDLIEALPKLRPFTREDVHAVCADHLHIIDGTHQNVTCLPGHFADDRRVNQPERARLYAFDHPWNGMSIVERD